MLIYNREKPYSDGPEYLIFSPEELLEKQAALVPIPKVHLIRFHGCPTPHAKIRKKVVPAREILGNSDPKVKQNDRKLDSFKFLRK